MEQQEDVYIYFHKGNSTWSTKVKRKDIGMEYLQAYLRDKCILAKDFRDRSTSQHISSDEDLDRATDKKTRIDLCIL